MFGTQRNLGRSSALRRVARVIGAGIALAALMIVAFELALHAQAGAPFCLNNSCVLIDTTGEDFASGQFYLTGVRNVGDGEIQLLPIGITSNWVTDTQSLPDARAELAAVIYRDNVLVIGGYDGLFAEQTTIFSATTALAGGITAPGWRTLDNLPNPRASMAAVISPTASGGILYVVGGSINSVFTSSIVYRAFDGNAVPSGAWASASMSNALVYPQAVVHGGNLYVLGGHDLYNSFSSIYRAPINADGSLGSWVLETNGIPDVGGNAGRYSFGAATFSSGTGTDYIYIVAGQAGSPPNSSVAVSAVFYAQFNNDGSIGAWTTANSLNKAFSAHALVQGGGQLLVTGGSEGIGTSQAITAVQSALIDENNGALRDLGGGRFWIVSSPLAEPRLYHASVINSGGQVYVLGGYNTSGVPRATVYRGSAAGIGNAYAPAGHYESRMINFGGSYQLGTLKWNTTVAAGHTETMTMQYRIAATQSALDAQPWTSIGQAAAGSDITNTYVFPGGQFGNYFQYQVVMTASAPYTRSPALNLVELQYSANGPDLQVSQSDGFSTAILGQVLTYTIVYTNNDVRTVPGVVLTQTPPISTTFIGGTAGWAAHGQYYLLTLGTVGPLATATATFVVQVTGKPASGVINSVVAIGYDGSLGLDPDPVNNASIDSDSVAVVDLYGSTDDLRSSIVVSSTNFYTVSYGNSGQLTASGVVVTSTIPQGSRYVGGPQWTSLGGNIFVFDAGTLTPGSVGETPFTVYISGTYPLYLPFTHTVSIGYNGAQGPDGDPANNVYRDVDNVVPGGSDLSISLTDHRLAVLPSDVLTYTISYINKGGFTALNVMLTETVPANTTFVGPGGWNLSGGATYTRTASNVSAGETFSTTFVVQVNPAAPLGPITNTARLGADTESALVQGNNVAVDVDVVSSSRVDMVAAISDGLSTPRAGQVLTYTINYSNNATSAASGVVLTVSLSAGLAYTGSGWTPAGGGVYFQSIGSVAALGNGARALWAQVDPLVAAGTYISASAAVDFAGLDAFPDNNLALDVDYMAGPHMVLVKDDGAAVVQPGQVLTYVLTYRNSGATLATGLVITESPPAANVSIVDTTGWNAGAGIYTRSLPSLAPGALASVSFVVQVLPGAANGSLITNTATVRTPADSDPLSTDGAFRDVDLVSTAGAPDIRITGARIASGSVHAFEPTALVVTVTNAGPVGTGTWFFVDLYADQAPLARTQLGDLGAPPYYIVDALGAGQTVTITYAVTFNRVGQNDLYLQADTCDYPGNCADPSYGRVAESNEANNILGPIQVTVLPGRLFLPIIAR
ncbi:MAG: DUF11 domain-containing protein [Chloroflexi bacterium]|nr:DUF11 domain-containing protein [Chloroflexota bacterium]